MTANKSRSEDKGIPRNERRRFSVDAPRRVTMTDIARVAGCSQATVSFVLNKANGVKISEATRNRVIEAARTLNYAATSLAHHDVVGGVTSLNLAQVDMLGFVVDQLATSPEAVVAIEGVRQAMRDQGSVMMIAQTMNDPEMEERVLRTMVAKGANALIYMTIFTRKVTLPVWIGDLAVPVILLNCYTAERSFPSVIPGEVAGGQKATQHLIDHGHRRIGVITGEPWMEATRDRLKGYRRALSGARIGFDPALVITGDWSASSGYEGTRRLLAMAERPTAIFCQNDRMAIGCYEALKEAGIVIPDGMSVVGYDDEEISRHLHPQLTTVVLPQRAMGAWAVKVIATGPEQATEGYPVTKLDCDLIARLSVTRPPYVSEEISPDRTPIG
ncbi:LacI family DNA-binding transcriptional regulator [Tabrizicola sp.]|uniref:LacI family DNA-binding transcriptional regulator n=1 Tax=Tabrizicola sp. TaxID=2005166 RepID=UPI00286C0E04|nr:LacI family DNA-binding transcriptional regulator [Tabrizicola sp.]